MNFDKIRNFSGLKDLTAMGIANVIGNVISAIFWFYLAALLGAENYGEVSYWIAIASIAATFPLLGSANTITVYTAKKVNILPAVSLISISASVITAIILIIIFENPSISLFAIGYVILNISFAELLGRKFYRSYAKAFVIQKSLVVVFCISLYFIMGVNGVILGFALAYLPFSYLIAKRIKQLGLDLSVLKPRLRFMMNNYTTDLSSVFSQNIDKLIIGPMLGFALLGNYYLGIQFLSVLTIFPGLIFSYILPQDASGTPRNTIKKITILFSIIFAIIGISITPFLIPFFFPQFEDAIVLIQIMSIAIIPRTITLMLRSKFLGREKSKFVVLGAVIFLSIQIPAIFVLGDLFGVGGIAVSLVLAETVQALFLFISSRYIHSY